MALFHPLQWHAELLLCAMSSCKGLGRRKEEEESLTGIQDNFIEAKE